MSFSQALDRNTSHLIVFFTRTALVAHTHHVKAFAHHLESIAEGSHIFLLLGISPVLKGDLHLVTGKQPDPEHQYSHVSTPSISTGSVTTMFHVALRVFLQSHVAFLHAPGQTGRLLIQCRLSFFSSRSTDIESDARLLNSVSTMLQTSCLGRLPSPWTASGFHFAPWALGKWVGR